MCGGVGGACPRQRAAVGLVRRRCLRVCRPRRPARRKLWRAAHAPAAGGGSWRRAQQGGGGRHARALDLPVARRSRAQPGAAGSLKPSAPVLIGAPRAHSRLHRTDHVQLRSPQDRRHEEPARAQAHAAARRAHQRARGLGEVAPGRADPRASAGLAQGSGRHARAAEDGGARPHPPGLLRAHPGIDRQRQKEYGSDITYGQNNEFGFDYLRDNMKFRLADYVQRELHYAIVDEVDSILIDEARTPLIISGPSEESTDKYYKINKVIPGLVRDRDFTVDEKARSVVLTDEGVEKVEAKLGVPNLYDPEQIETLHHVEQALRAHTLYRKDHEYVVKDGEVTIVADFTGRLMPGRRWSDGLHQAVEAKENVKIENENQTLATVSFQNYFRLYTKLAGMTGTADTEAAEFAQIYKLEVLVIPTNRTNIRKDLQDTVYKTEREKFKAVCDDVEERWKKGQPVLVGTVSIAKSEVLSNLLKKRGVPHDVLNAKQHEREAEIVAQAGRKGRITISTNMAGRGTDILLGGNPEFLAKRDVGPEPTPQDVEGRLVQVLPLPRRRPDADLRQRSDFQADGDLRRPGERAHRAPLAHQGHRGGAEAGRGAELRHPQEPARVRRRDEPATQDHLLDAQG